MAWIESHQSLANHPKLIHLCELTQWDKFAAIGRLHCHWYWCLDYAIDGDLRKFSDAQIAFPMGVSIGEAKLVVGSLVEACWLDRVPYFRVHDWWDYAGLFIMRRYGDKNRAKWEAIQQLYNDNTIVAQSLPPPTQPTVPNLTKPTHPPDAGARVELPRSPIPNGLASFDLFWSAYPKQVKRTDAEHAFIESGAHLCVDQVIAAVEVQKRSQLWKKQSGQYIPNPGNWLRDKQWLDQTPEMRQRQRKIDAISRI